MRNAIVEAACEGVLGRVDKFTVFSPRGPELAAIIAFRRSHKESISTFCGRLKRRRARPQFGIYSIAWSKYVNHHAPIRLVLLVSFRNREGFVLAVRQQHERVELAASLVISFAVGVGATAE